MIYFKIIKDLVHVPKAKTRLYSPPTFLPLSETVQKSQIM